jgi:hypothetical protein
LGCLIGLGVEIILLAGGLLLGAKIWTLFVGADNRLSTSKAIATLWTLVVAALLFGTVYANWLGHPQALNVTNSSGIVGQYAVLFGGPLGSAILAKQIVNSQTATKAKQPATSPALTDLIANDAGEADLGDLQYVLFNLVAFVFVIGTMMHAPTSGLPHIPDVLLGLTSVSATGYVGKKALTPKGLVSATIESATAQGPPTTGVRIDVKGLTPRQTVLNALVVFDPDVAGGQAPAHAAVIDGTTTLIVPSPDIGAAANTAVKLTIVTDDGMVLHAGTYTYTAP